MLSESASLTISTAITIGVLNSVFLQAGTGQLPNSSNWQGWFVAGMAGLVALITAYYHDRRNVLKLQVVELIERQKESARKLEALIVAEQRLEPLSMSHKADEEQVHSIGEQVTDDRHRIATLSKENAELKALCDRLRNEIDDLRQQISKLDPPNAPPNP